MMTKEQIADRIREEFRKHGKNDPEGWPLIAAAKVLAQMREEAGAQRYYFYTWWRRRPPYDMAWEPMTNVCEGTHPFEKLKNEASYGGYQARLSDWQEITKDEYEQLIELRR